MDGQRRAIDLGRVAAGADTLTDFKDDVCKSILVDVHLLVVGDLAQIAKELAVSFLSLRPPSRSYYVLLCVKVQGPRT